MGDDCKNGMLKMEENKSGFIIIQRYTQKPTLGKGNKGLEA